MVGSSVGVEVGSGVALGVGLIVILDVGVEVLGSVTTAMRVGGNVGIGVGVGKTGCTRVGTTVGTAWSANRVGSSLALRRFGVDPGVANRIAGTGVTDASVVHANAALKKTPMKAYINCSRIIALKLRVVSWPDLVLIYFILTLTLS